MIILSLGFLQISILQPPILILWMSPTWRGYSNPRSLFIPMGNYEQLTSFLGTSRYPQVSKLPNTLSKRRILGSTKLILRCPATSSHPILQEEVTKIIEVVDYEEDFDVFDHPSPLESPCASSVYLPFAQVSSIQESSDIPDAMVL